MFSVSSERNPTNDSHFLCHVVLSCSLLWPISVTSKQWLLLCVDAIDSTCGYYLGNIMEYAEWGIVSTGVGEKRISLWPCLWI